MSMETDDQVDKIRIDGSNCIITLGEQLTIYDVSALRDAFIANWHSGQDVQLDFSGTQELDTTGVQLLLAVKKKVEESGGELQAVNVSDETRSFFNLYGLNSITDSSLEAA